MSGLYIVGGKDGRTPVRCYDDRAWARWFEGADRCVAFTGNEHCYVSTVFLGIDSNFYIGKGWKRPVVFETMVFRGGKSSHEDGEFERYSTWDEAEAGHAEIAARVFARQGVGAETVKRPDAT